MAEQETNILKESQKYAELQEQSAHLKDGEASLKILVQQLKEERDCLRVELADTQAQLEHQNAECNLIRETEMATRQEIQTATNLAEEQNQFFYRVGHVSPIRPVRRALTEPTNS